MNEVNVKGLDTINYPGRGAAVQVHGHVALARRPGYIPAGQFQALTDLIGELIRMINGYIAYLKRTGVGVGKSVTSDIRLRDHASSQYLSPISCFLSSHHSIYPRTL